VRDVVLSVLAVLLALVIGGHRAVPGNAGVLVDTALPWLGAGVPVLAVVALLLRSRVGAVAVLLPALVWAGLFGPQVLRRRPDAPGELRVATQNFWAGNPDAAGTARRLAATGAGVIAGQELEYDPRTKVDGVLAAAGYRYSRSSGTVGLWSRYPITESSRVDIGIGFRPGLRARIATPHGQVVVYVVHLASIRPGESAARDRTLARLRARLHADTARRTLVLGDLNTATTDRALDRLSPLREAQTAAGSGFGFTWPARFPVTRPDHILFTGMRPVSAQAVRTTGSDHRAAVASFDI
jgi:vancomycin resistance protein VanJ